MNAVRNMKSWVETHPKSFVCILTVGLLAPFLSKPFHIDDPLFIWAARQIRIEPFDFFGFTVNWDADQPMYLVTKNPPLASYFIAAASLLVGWNEIGLHAAFLLPAVGAALGTFVLAREFCSRPLFATLAGIVSPAFLVSSTTVMCDTLMVCFWVWSIVFWKRGLDQKSSRLLAAAAGLISLSFLSKFFGICLVPLLAVYTLGRRDSRKHLPWLLLPGIIVAGYHFWTHHLYGVSHLRDTQSFVTTLMPHHSSAGSAVIGLLFLGGCYLTPLLAVLCGNRWAAWYLFAAALTLTFFPISPAYRPFLGIPRSEAWIYSTQFFAFALSGLALLYSVLISFIREKSAESLLLFNWVAGTFLFTVFINWTINVRSLLPLAPAVGIVLVRAVKVDSGARWIASILVLSLSLGAALLVAAADFSHASRAMEAARAISSHPAGNPPGQFQGAWGFQYYMQESGWKCINGKDLPSRGIKAAPLPGPSGPRRLAVFQFPSCLPISAMNSAAGAGFYANFFGPFPYSFGGGLQLEYGIFQLQPPAEPLP